VLGIVGLLFGLGCCACPPDGDVGRAGDEAEPSREPADRDPLGKADGQCGPFPPGYYRYLDDTKCAKRLPSNRDRELVCPNVATSATVVTSSGSTVTYRPAAEPGDELEVDTTALRGLVPDDLKVTIILVRRVGGVPHYRYLSNGHHDDAVQPWSSTKFLAIANGAARLREASGQELGLTGSVDGWPLGDLVTMVHGYDERYFSSNGLARYFHDVGGRAAAQQLVSDWLGRPPGETFGGNYGAPSAPLGFTFVDGDASVEIEPDLSAGPANQLSTFTLAESLKRLVMHREDEATRLAGLEWADVRTLLYGADASRLYGAASPQGMEADTAIYLQQSFDVGAMDARSGGKWRIFSKLGHGTSRGGEFVHVGYACLPELNAAGTPVLDHGKELIIATFLNAHARL
jgi:hypothetical protein